MCPHIEPEDQKHTGAHVQQYIPYLLQACSHTALLDKQAIYQKLGPALIPSQTHLEHNTQRMRATTAKHCMSGHGPCGMLLSISTGCRQARTLEQAARANKQAQQRTWGSTGTANQMHTTLFVCASADAAHGHWGSRCNSALFTTSLA